MKDRPFYNRKYWGPELPCKLIKRGTPVALPRGPCKKKGEKLEDY